MLEINQVSFAYKEEAIIKAITFKIKVGQTVAVMGASGSGKSSLLKLIYGLLDADSGQLFWKQQEIRGPKFHLVPGMDYIKYLAQDFDLMPYVSVAENVGRFLSNFYLKEKTARIEELLDLVDMTAFANVKAQFLSGGQMQRVALARVLALEPEVLLLDEPFSHIDPHQKSRLAQHLFRYCKQKNITVIFTSHTPDEALMFADEILVLQDGELIEQDTPVSLYKYPKSEYIARLTGEVNVIPLRYLGKETNDILFVRPHQIMISERGLEAHVLQSFFKGDGYLLNAQFKDLVVTIFSKIEIKGMFYFEIKM